MTTLIVISFVAALRQDAALLLYVTAVHDDEHLVGASRCREFKGRVGLSFSTPLACRQNTCRFPEIAQY
jgi:hypothetical protein